MKIQLDLENVVYFDFTDCKNPILKVTCVKTHTYRDGSCRWDILLDVPRSPQIIKLNSIRGTKEDAIAEANHLMGYYTDFEQWAYELYKRAWCDSHGYSSDEIDENGFNSGECYVCMEEYLNNEFVEEKATLYALYEKAKTICDYMVKEGCAETTQGNWIYYFEELSKKYEITQNELSNLIPYIVTYLDMFPEEVCDVLLDGESIDINFYTNFCPNIETNDK